MAKGLYCAQCGAIKTFPANGTTVSCDCLTGPVVGWWVDTTTALAQMAVLPPGDRSKARVVMIHNGYLRADIESDGEPPMIPTSYTRPDGQPGPFDPSQVDVLWREVHNQATIAPQRPEAITIFDRSRRACPLVVAVPGTVPDTHWATEPELLRRGLLDSGRG